MKTNVTMKIEQALYNYSGADTVGVYGGFEVTLGSGYGDERIDFITLDNVFGIFVIMSPSREIYDVSNCNYLIPF